MDSDLLRRNIDRKIADLDSELLEIDAKLQKKSPPMSQTKKKRSPEHSPPKKRRKVMTNGNKKKLPLSVLSDREIRERRTERVKRYKKKLKMRSKNPMDYIEILLKDLIAHENSWPFLYPVDAVALGVPNYFEYIKEPMDLNTIQERINDDKYTCIEDFVGDVRLIWRNAMIFNPQDSSIYVYAHTLKDYFEDMYSKLNSFLARDDDDKKSALQTEYMELEDELDELVKEEKEISMEIEDLTKKEKRIPAIKNVDKGVQMDYEERMKVFNWFKKLDDVQMIGINRILEQDMPETLNTSEDTVELESDLMDVKVLRKFEAYVFSCFGIVKSPTKSPKRKNILPPKPPTPTLPSRGIDIIPETDPFPEIQRKVQFESSSMETSSSESDDSSSESSDDIDEQMTSFTKQTQAIRS